MYLLRHGLARVSAAGCAASLLAVVPGLAAAQISDSVQNQQAGMGSAQPSAIATDGSTDNTAEQKNKHYPGRRQSGMNFEPRVTVQHTVTNNAQLNNKNLSDQVTEVMPGFSLIGDTARFKGFVDYTLRAANYARDTASDKIWHSLFAKGTVEAVESHAFVDFDARATLQPISAFGPSGGNNPANANLTQTTSYRISPYLRGHLDNGLNYEARYGITDTSYDTAARTDVSMHDWLLHFGRQPAGQLLSWGVDATQQNADYSSGRNIDTTSLRGNLGYMPISQLRLMAIGGFESTNQISPTRESNNIFGFGFDWRPSDRTSIYFEREKRYFGESHNAVAQYRTARTVWRYTDKRAVVNGLDAQRGSLGSLFDLLDGFYTRTEPNAIRRMQLVQAEIARMGLPADTQIFQDFLTSSSTLQRMQQLSLALLGQRSTLTMLAMRSDTRLLQNSLQLGDDFNNDRNIRQRGWSLTLGHRLTPNSSITASFGETRSIGSDSGLKTRTRPFVLGWNFLAARHTNVGIQMRRVLSDGNVSRYGESAITGFIAHRF